MGRTPRTRPARLTFEALEPRLPLSAAPAMEPVEPSSYPSVPGPILFLASGGASGAASPAGEGIASSATLRGVLPRQVDIVDLATGELVYQHWSNTSQLDVSFLFDGTYLLRHAASGESPAGLRLIVDKSCVVQSDTELTRIALAGTLPRWVQVTDLATSNVAFEGWHYAHDFDPSVFPVGDYLLQHASSGEGRTSIAFTRSTVGSSYVAIASPNIRLEGSLPRRVQVVDSGTGRTVSDFWNYHSDIDISSFPGPGTYLVSHAGSGEFWRRDVVVVGADLPSYRIHARQTGSGKLDIDWGALHNDRAFYLHAEQDGRELFSAWHYDSHLPIAVGAGNVQLRVYAPNRRVAVASVPVVIDDIYEVPPARIPTKVGVAGTMRQDLLDLGQYQVAPIELISSVLGCSQEHTDEIMTLRCGTTAVEWRKETDSLMAGDSVFNSQNLPLVPYREGTTLYFPVRILAEALGWNTRFDPTTMEVTVFKLKAAARSVTLQLDMEISGSDLDFSYFMMAHETRNELYLVHDHARAILRFQKPDYVYEQLTIDPAYGYLLEFAVHPDRTIYAATTSGVLVRWTGDRFEPVLGMGTRELVQAGDSASFADFHSSSMTHVVTRSDGRVLYLMDVNTGRLYEADLTSRQVRLLVATGDMGPALDLELYRDRPLVVTLHNQLVWVDPATLTSERSSCFERLFDPISHRVYSVRYLPSKDVWVVPSASTRVIHEARFTFDSESGGCETLRQAYSGDKTAFLNGIGSIDPEIDTGDRVLVIDSDGFNIVNYRVPGSMTLISNDDLLRHAHRRFLAPTNIAESQGNLYIVGNISHQVVRYQLSTGVMDVYAGTGVPVRSSVASTPRLSATMGYPNDIEFLGDSLWVGDHYSRRLLAIEGQVAMQPFAPPDYRSMSGIVSIDVTDDYALMVDHALGQVLQWREGQEAPSHLAGAIDPRSEYEESEKIRRSAAASSMHTMRDFASVQFGLPVSVETMSDGRIVVTDLYRHGMWLLDPKDQSVQRLAGMNANTTYHFGGFTANAGLEAAELRLGSPVFVEHDAERKILVVAGGYNEAAVFLRDDFSKSCVVTSDVALEYVSHAMFLNDGRFAVVDTPRNKIYVFKPPPLGCLDTPNS